MANKTTRIFVLVNTLQGVSSFVYGNHIPFFVYTAKHRPDIEFKFWPPHRTSIDNARNSAAIMAMQMECDYLMFLDDDVLIPPDTLIKLLEADKDVCAGLVIIRGMPFNVMAFKFEKDNEDENLFNRNLTYYNELPLQEPCAKGHEKFQIDCDDCFKVPLVKYAKCDAVGFSCCLIKTDILLPLEPPYFLTGKNHTEDVYFCMKLRTLEPIPEVYMDTSVQCAHLLNPEGIEWATRRKFREFYAEQFKKYEDPGRNQDYLDACLAQVHKV